MFWITVFMRAIAKCTNSHNKVFHYFLVFVAIPAITAELEVPRVRCNKWHWYTGLYYETEIEVWKKAIESHCHAELNGLTMQYNCYIEGGADRCARRLGTYANEIDHNMFAVTLNGDFYYQKSEVVANEVIQKLKDRGLCEKIQSKNRTDFGCASTWFTFYYNNRWQKHYKMYYICGVDHPRRVKEFVEFYD
ncbi:unnamed protein product [Cylicocyclus nassatus]|uniref:Uncharacterized protein n=1 Tax=Cylicocyclus nassatus TaxID=53992 RepID=A0AA36H7K1_CYLNA|nr:unnamed protein product [Cylicocyclus nassatus]